MPAVDLATAAVILDRAFREAEMLSDTLSRNIDDIIRGPHKTYRYILVTALLAKATNEEIDILSLQKADGQNGKYDARSLCHKVLVPFETLKLPGCLGSSNEPFLNKPARFVALSVENAVRRGRDSETLRLVIDTLSQMTDSKVAYRYLKVAVAVMKTVHEEYVSKFSITESLIDISEFSQLVLDYIYALTEFSQEGAVCPLIVAQLERMYLGKDCRVEAHKINQSGASSQEVGDIDVYDANKRLLYSIEVKDKNFTVEDVAHAIRKFRSADLSNSLFIYGKKVSFDEDKVHAFLRETGRHGHYCCLISILQYAKLRVSDLKTLPLHAFVSGLLSFAKAINAHDETVDIIKDIAQKIFRQ